MFELIDKSERVRHFVYIMAAAFVTAVFIWRLPDLLAALK